MKKVAILGGGEIGSALDFSIMQDRAEVLVWDKDEKRNKSGKTLKEAVYGADFVCFMMPAFAVPQAFESIKEFLNNDVKIVLISKALDPEGKTVVQVVRDLGFGGDLIYIGGPMIAEEIMAGRGGYAVISSNNIKTAEEFQYLIDDNKVISEISNDLDGTALCGTLKNVYAIALGIIDGKEKGVNTKAYMTLKSLEEMERLINQLGGSGQTVRGVAGEGDLLATGWSKDSSNRSAGENLVRTHEVKPNEGFYSIEALKNRLGDDISKFPILQSVVNLISEK